MAVQLIIIIGLSVHIKLKKNVKQRTKTVTISTSTTYLTNINTIKVDKSSANNFNKAPTDFNSEQFKCSDAKNIKMDDPFASIKSLSRSSSQISFNLDTKQ